MTETQLRSSTVVVLEHSPGTLENKQMAEIKWGLMVCVSVVSFVVSFVVTAAMLKWFEWLDDRQ